MSARKKIALTILLAALLFSLFTCGVTQATIQEWKNESNSARKSHDDAIATDDAAMQEQNDRIRDSLP